MPDEFVTLCINKDYLTLPYLYHSKTVLCALCACPKPKDRFI